MVSLNAWLKHDRWILFTYAYGIVQTNYKVILD